MRFMLSFWLVPSRLPTLEPIRSIVVTTTSRSFTSQGWGKLWVMTPSRGRLPCFFSVLTCDLVSTCDDLFHHETEICAQPF